MLELLVAVIQAYVSALLTAVLLNGYTRRSLTKRSLTMGAGLAVIGAGIGIGLIEGSSSSYCKTA